MASGNAAPAGNAPTTLPQEFFESEQFDSDLYANHVVQYPGEYSLCLGCRSCELLCGLVRDGKSGLNRGGIRVQRGGASTNLHTVLTCQQCWDHPCYDACPLQGEAMDIDENGIVYVIEEGCIGCGLCAKACVLEPSRIVIVGKKKERKARKCDLCRDRADGPVCISDCPALCIALSDDALALRDARKGA